MEIKISDFKKINDYLWEIPRTFRKMMRAPARIYASKKILEKALEDNSLKQLVNVTTLPGIEKYAIAMPDIHEGYGFPIGGVAGIDLERGVISPGGIGFDINCGVRLIISPYKKGEVEKYLENLSGEIYRQVPSGLGKGRKLKFSFSELDQVLSEGVHYLIERGYGEKEDSQFCEGKGNLLPNNPERVSRIAKQRGQDQLGTLGSGNHFLEIQEVREIFDSGAAKIFGLFLGQVAIMIHTGSRGLGHQVATDYLRKFVASSRKYNVNLPDRELAAVPFKTEEGQSYFQAMNSAANFAFANRQLITHFLRKSFENILGTKPSDLRLLYDVAHNIAKIEEYEVSGRKKKLIVHRKGATRAFPPNHPELPEQYKETGQPVLIPGSMGTASYLALGTEASKEAFYTVNHGAGRTMSRRKAVKTISGEGLLRELEKKGIIVKSDSPRGLAEEAPLAYKDIEDVMEVVVKAGLAKKVAKLKPLAVIKGS